MGDLSCLAELIESINENMCKSQPKIAKAADLIQKMKNEKGVFELNGTVGSKLSASAKQAIQLSKGPLNPEKFMDFFKFFITYDFRKPLRQVLPFLRKCTHDIEGVREQLLWIKSEIPEYRHSYVKEQKRLDDALVKRIESWDKKLTEELRGEITSRKRQTIVEDYCEAKKPRITTKIPQHFKDNESLLLGGAAGTSKQLGPYKNASMSSGEIEPMSVEEASTCNEDTLSESLLSLEEQSDASSVETEIDLEEDTPGFYKQKKIPSNQLAVGLKRRGKKVKQEAFSKKELGPVGSKFQRKIKSESLLSLEEHSDASSVETDIDLEEDTPGFNKQKKIRPGLLAVGLKGRGKKVKQKALSKNECGPRRSTVGSKFQRKTKSKSLLSPVEHRNDSSLENEIDLEEDTPGFNKQKKIRRSQLAVGLKRRGKKVKQEALSKKELDPVRSKFRRKTKSKSAENENNSDNETQEDEEETNAPTEYDIQNDKCEFSRWREPNKDVEESSQHTEPMSIDGSSQEIEYMSIDEAGDSSQQTEYMSLENGITSFQIDAKTSSENKSQSGKLAESFSDYTAESIEEVGMQNTSKSRPKKVEQNITRSNKKAKTLSADGSPRAFEQTESKTKEKANISERSGTKPQRGKQKAARCNR